MLPCSCQAHLHLAVAVVQTLCTARHGNAFIYPYNDAYHALLNLFLAPAWGFEHGWSFNAPIWSVSVEVLLYASFFAVCLAGRWRWWLALTACALGAWLYPDHYKLGSGLLCFYVGGLSYGALNVLRRSIGPNAMLILTTVACVAAWCWPAGDAAVINAYRLMCVCFPLTLMMFASLNHRWPNLCRRWALLGEISFSTYLLHFPPQLVFVLVVDALGLPRTVFYQAWVMGLYLALLMPLSLLSYRLLERPTLRYLRQQGQRTA